MSNVAVLQRSLPAGRVADSVVDHLPFVHVLPGIDVGPGEVDVVREVEAGVAEPFLLDDLTSPSLLSKADAASLSDFERRSSTSADAET